MMEHALTHVQDFFYTCDTHLKDTHFALPIDEEYSEALRKKQRIDNQIKTLKARWDEKNRYAGWDKLMSYAKWSKDEKDDKNDKKDQESEDKSELKDLKEEVNDCDTILQRLPRVYELNGDIFKLRLEKRKPKPALESTKIKDTSMFPDAPKGNLS